MIVQIESFTAEINQYLDYDGLMVFGFKTEPNYPSIGFLNLDELFKALNSQVKLLIQEYGYCLPNYETFYPGQFADCEF